MIEDCIKMNYGPSPFEYLLNIFRRMKIEPDEPEVTVEKSKLLIIPLSKDPGHC
ncbi:hypothetical protein ES332_D07G275400v1 [Gossypium tomentosum]|uniref:Uncharacterized protein n=1 Tax=Gossypium tomentosum TaxID=34277 RepID=A0A5D2KD94_GOSTO|nr:hypothetical protein ES332_D07G275400v1 [Gossypium tomentosum]